MLMSDGKKDGSDDAHQASSSAALADHEPMRVHSQKEEEQQTSSAVEELQRRSLSPAYKQRGNDPAAAAAAEQEALQTLWRIVFANSLQWDTELRRLNTALALFGLVNFSLLILLYQLCWSSRTLHMSMGSECAIEPVLQLLSHLSYAGFVVLLVLYYSAKSGYIATISHFPSKWSAFWYSGLRGAFLAELAASMIQPFPVLYLVLEMKESQWLLLLALLAKLYLLLRVLRDFSSLYQKRHFIKVQQSQFDRSFFAMDTITIFKTYIYHHTSLVFFIGIASNAICLAYLMHLAEREYWLPRDAHTGVVARKWEQMASPVLIDPSPSHGSGSVVPADDYGSTIDLLATDAFGNTYFQPPFVSFLNCIYFVFIVATTTGLGDVSPSTPQGKIFAVIAALAGVVWTAFCVGVCTNKLVPSNFEAYCIDYLKRSEIEHHKQHWAAILIQRTWRLHRAWKSSAARGQPVSSGARKAQFIETLSPAIRQFQRIQREDANVQFIFQDPAGGAGGGNTMVKMPATAAGSAVSNPANQLGLRFGPAMPSSNSAEPRRVGELSNAHVARSSQQQPHGNFSPSPASPLMRSSRSPPQLYGTAGRRDDPRPINRRNSSISDRDDDAPAAAASAAMGTPQISARNAATMLHHLKRQSSTVGTPAGAGSSPPLLGGAGPLMGTPRRQTPSRSLAAGVGGGSYSAHANALASLAAQNEGLFASLRTMEQKIDLLLSASARSAIHENMVERGHMFVSWTSNGRTGLAEDAVASPMFLWHERDETKYGSLHWTTEEFAVQNRLRIKTPGNSFPLHSITDVHLGKVSPEFSLPATRDLSPSLCFSVVSKLHPSGLKLQSQHHEERSIWISQLKHAFVSVPRSGSGSSSGNRTPGGGHHAPTHSASTSQLPPAAQLAELSAAAQAAASSGSGGPSPLSSSTSSAARLTRPSFSMPHGGLTQSASREELAATGGAATQQTK